MFYEIWPNDKKRYNIDIVYWLTIVNVFNDNVQNFPAVNINGFSERVIQMLSNFVYDGGLLYQLEL